MREFAQLYMNDAVIFVLITAVAAVALLMFIMAITDLVTQMRRKTPKPLVPNSPPKDKGWRCSHD